MMSTNQDFAHEVIPNILQTIIKTNTLDLSIAEIEGDALFFYKTGRLPSVQKVARQCKAIYDAFNNFIASYKEIDIQNYEKYLANNQLGIIIIIHHGKISISNIEGHVKLMGEDVILVHKLFKNSVQQHNYILLTQQYLDTSLKTKKWLETGLIGINYRKEKTIMNILGLYLIIISLSLMFRNLVRQKHNQ